MDPLKHTPKKCTKIIFFLFVQILGLSLVHIIQKIETNDLYRIPNIGPKFLFFDILDFINGAHNQKKLKPVICVVSNHINN